MIIYFIGNVIFNKHFIKDISKFSKLKVNLLVKENYLKFDSECKNFHANKLNLVKKLVIPKIGNISLS